MSVTPLAIAGVFVLEPRIFADDRGAFFESFNAKAFAAATGQDPDFVQDNHSISAKGVLRGLHYQMPDYAQGKLVRVVKGEVFDVAVDLRRSSPTFGRWVGEYLSAENHKQLWIPEGFAHGFLALSEGTEFLYKTTNVYSAASERCILWNDDSLNIAWPIEGAPLLSPKDQIGRKFAEADVFD